MTARRIPVDLSVPCDPHPGHPNPLGYVRLRLDGRDQYAHRIEYEIHVGKIPDGWNVGHACHDAAIARGECRPGPCAHRRCREPRHLVAQSSAENSAAGGHPNFTTARTHVCRRGHDLTLAENQSIRRDGRVRCLPCQRRRP